MPRLVLDSSEPDGDSIDDLVARVEEIPWFENVGKPLSSASGEVGRIFQWEDWPGPEDPSVAAVHEIQQLLHNQLIADAGTRRIMLLTRWNRVLQTVLADLYRRFPVAANEDCYHALSSACLHAAWTTALVDLHGKLNRSVPLDLLEQWAWFACGHWPCGYSRFDEVTRSGSLLVL